MSDTTRAAPAQAAPQEPVADEQAAYSRWLADTHAPALRRMDSAGAHAAGWQAGAAATKAALAQAQEPVLRIDPAASKVGAGACALTVGDTHCFTLDVAPAAPASQPLTAASQTRAQRVIDLLQQPHIRPVADRLPMVPLLVFLEGWDNQHEQRNV